jgi:PQQ-dependent dehydrogenase (methanol/ethanol family)
MLSKIHRNLIAAGLMLGIASAAIGKDQPDTPVKPAAVDGARIIAADKEPGNWMSHGRTYSEQRYSPLQQINGKTVDKLGLAWFHDFDTARGMEATPLMVDGVIYTTSSWSKVHALDARTGKLLWSYDPKVRGEKLRHTCCGPVNRGVAAWQGQVFVGALDGRLIALDAATGKVNWEVATVDTTLPYTITGAPRIIDGKVLIGNGGAEFGVRGFITAYDANNGKQLWRFYTIPGNPKDGFESDAMAKAAKTWNGEWWKIGGGGTVWDSMAYDPELNLLYVGVGNGTPWNRDIRSPGGGDNLYLSSIVALRPDTGEYVWHYQTTPGESWDYTATQHIILADMELEGKTRKVLMQAPKNGFFYVLDRTDGKLLSANNYVQTTWATHIDMQTGRPVETPDTRYKDKPTLQFPSYLGGHNWHPMSYNPNTGLVYIPAQDIPAVYAQPAEFVYRPGAANTGIDAIAASLPDDEAERRALGAMVKGRLLAWNPKTQSEAWHVEYNGPWNGGTLSTAGNLVFQGTADGRFVAYSADKGEQLWEFPAQTGIVAAPITYELDGEQYMAVSAGWGGSFALVFGEYVQDASGPNASRLLVFKLGAKGELPKREWQRTVAFNPPEQTASEAVVYEGFGLYQDVCMGCHGLNAVSGSLIPDLRGSAYLGNPPAWKAVIAEGVLKDRGMAAFGDVLTEQQIEAIRAYVIQQSWRGLQVQKAREQAAN